MRNKKVLNLFAGIGGNRKGWENVDVTSIEFNHEIAKIYKQYYPNDTVIVCDAHEFLLKNYKEFDFIWSSPPCQTHSKIRMMASKRGSYDAKFPDMKLWEEIIFLTHFSKCKFVVENVVPYYKPLVNPSAKIGKHLFWSNFQIDPKLFQKEDDGIRHSDVTGTTIRYGYDLSGHKINHRKDQIIRNMVDPKLGLFIYNQSNSNQQLSLFTDY